MSSPLGASLFLVICFSLSSLSDAGPIWETTVYGDKCSTKCDYYGESYTWCYKLDAPRDDAWSYCSKYPQMTRYGDVCANECSQDGERYYWCWIDETQTEWEYCSVSVARRSQATSEYGEYCLSECTRDGEIYNWCDTTQGWDYCSRSSGYAAYGRRCVNTCEKRGYDYRNCGTNGGGQNEYCGIVDSNVTIISKSTDQDVCNTPCEAGRCGTYRNSLRDCDLNDPNYWIEDFSCSLLRHNGQCRLPLDTNREVVWSREEVHSSFLLHIDQSQQQQRDGNSAIALVDQIIGVAPGTILYHGTTRINLQLQGNTSHGMMNIQTQVNGPPAGQPSSIAGIKVRQSEVADLPSSFIRAALVTSLRENRFISIEIE